MFYRSSNMCKLTFHNFTSEPAPAAANKDDLVSYYDSCMVIPRLAGKEDRYEGQCDIFKQPQCCIVSPSILATAPRDAISQGVYPTARHKLSPVVDYREGVVVSPLGGE